jgi:hypothetical protein
MIPLLITNECGTLLLLHEQYISVPFPPIFSSASTSNAMKLGIAATTAIIQIAGMMNLQ